MSDSNPTTAAALPAKKPYHTNRGGRYVPVKAKTSQKVAARALYEGEPGSTCLSVATELKVPVGTVRRWKSEDAAQGVMWKSVARTIHDLSGRAGALANTFETKMSELGKPMSDEVAVQEAAKEVSIGFATDVRAAILDRHRKEWAAPRALAYKAMKGEGNFEVAKLAKISAETLTLIQAGECRAYGMDQAARGADANKTLVLIDRGSEPEPQGDRLEFEPLPNITDTPGTETGGDHF